MRWVMMAAVLAAAAPAAAADWRLAAESDRGVSYLDMGSVARDGGSVRFSRWMVLGGATAARGDNLRDAFAADCASGRYHVTRAELFNADRSVGILPPQDGIAEEGSVLASLVAIACGRQKPDGPAVPDPLAAGKARLAAARGGG